MRTVPVIPYFYGHLAGGGRIDAGRVGPRPLQGGLQGRRPGVAPRPQASHAPLLLKAQASERGMLRELREGHLSDAQIGAYESFVELAKQQRLRRM